MNMIYHGPDTVYQFKHMQNRWAEKSNILLNKIQYVSMILAVLNSFLYSKNTDVYIMTSNKNFFPLISSRSLEETKLLSSLYFWEL